MTIRPRLVILVSGNGSNLQSILDACAGDWLNADVVAVFSNKADVPALARAERSGVPAFVVTLEAGEDRRHFDSRLASLVADFEPTFVVLAGYMRLLTMEFLSLFPGRVINLHPALPGELAGTHAIERAFQESRDNWRTHSGVTVHFVPDEGVDDGPVLGSSLVPIFADDTLETFEERMHTHEHQLLVETLQTLCQNEFSVPTKGHTS